MKRDKLTILVHHCDKGSNSTYWTEASNLVWRWVVGGLRGGGNSWYIQMQEELVAEKKSESGVK